MDENQIGKLEEIFGVNRLKRNEPMSSHTTLKIGGPAEVYIELDSLEDLSLCVKTAYELRIPIFVFGGGSNLLVSDNGIKGLVIKNNCRKFDVISMAGKVKNNTIGVDKALLYAESGAIMNQVVRFSIDQGLEGLEYQLGLPGTIGGAVYMNSYFEHANVRAGDCVQSARIIKKDGTILTVDREYFQFSRDRSSLQENEDILLSIVFKLTPSNKEELWSRGTQALGYRTTAMSRGVGSGLTFRNISIVEAISTPTPNRTTSAEYLISQAGLKGKRVGDAMICEEYPNFIMNMGNATAKDVVELVEIVKTEVFKKYGVHLSLEVKTIGF